MKISDTAPRWMTITCIAWICVVVAISIRPFERNLAIFRQVDPRLYLAMLGALAVGVVAAAGYHFVRRRGFWRWEPIVLPAAFVLLCAVYSAAAVAVALWIAAAGYAIGSFAARKLGLQADAAVSTLAGFGIFSVILFALGVSHALYFWVLVVLLALPLALFWRRFGDLAGEARSMYRNWIGDAEIVSSHVGVAVFAAIILAAVAAATMLTPAWNGDTIEFHLPLIRVFLASHALTVPHTISYGYYPQGFEVLAATAYAIGGQMAAQALNPLFFSLASLVLFRIARACGVSRSWAVAGVVLGASIPFVHWSGSVTKNDFALAAYQLAALLCWFRWRDTRVFRWLTVSAFFIAMSFGIKHVAIFGAIPWALACLYALWREPRRFRRIGSLAAVVIVFGLWWPGRSFVETGNPIAPASIGFVKQRTGKSRHGVWWLNGYYAQFRGKGKFQSPTQNPAGIVLLLLVPLCLIRRAGKSNWKSEAVLWAYVILYYPTWALEAGVLRYAIAPVLLLAMLGAGRLTRFRPSLGVTAMAVALLFSIPIVVLIEMAPAQIPLFLKQIDAATFLRRTLPPYGAVEFLDRHASPSDSVASIGDWAVAYAPNPANFHVYYLNQRRYAPEAVQRQLQAGDRYLILPKASNLGELEAAAGQSRVLTRVYQDRDFVVDALQPRSR